MNPDLIRSYICKGVRGGVVPSPFSIGLFNNSVHPGNIGLFKTIFIGTVDADIFDEVSITYFNFSDAVH